MRVLINMPSQYAGRPSGVALLNFCLLEALLARGDAEYVLRSPWRREDLPQGLQTRRLEVVVTPRPRIMVLDVLLQSLKVGWLCRKRGIDVVLNADPFGAATGGRARVTVVHDLYFVSLRQQLGWRAVLTMGLVHRWVLRGSSRIVTISNATRADLASWRPRHARKATTIYPAAVMAELAPPEGRARQDPYVLLVGNATPNKNFKVAARAVAGLGLRYPDLGIVHVGADPGETVRAELQALGAGTALERLVDVDEARLRALYRDAVCLAVPSLGEGFCLPILEAQSQGCPVICGDVSAMPEIAGDGALLFSPTEPGALAAHIEALLTDSGLRERLVAAGHRNRSRFSWADSASRYHAVLVDALKEAR